jgi:hypothetical protein
LNRQFHLEVLAEALSDAPTVAADTMSTKAVAGRWRHGLTLIPFCTAALHVDSIASFSLDHEHDSFPKGV